MRTSTVNKVKVSSWLLNGLLVLVVAWLIHYKSSIPTIESLIEGSADVSVPSFEETLPDLPGDPSLLVEPRCGKNDLTWLACAVYFEARNQDLPGQYFVALTVLNRVHDSRWPNTIEKVVRQGEERRNRCQYSFMCDGKSEHIKNAEAWVKAVQIAALAIKQHARGRGSTCAHSYHADYVTSERALRWFTSLSKDDRLGDHIFYCDKPLGVIASH